MPDLSKIFVFRMTHIENIPHILLNGITHSASANANPNYAPIGDGTLINTRNNFLLNNGNCLGNYIPFYFGVLTPMLYVIQNGYLGVKQVHPENIVYCVCSVQNIINNGLDFVFTDGHAIEKISSQYTLADIANIEALLDFKAIKDSNFKDPNDLDKKRRKQAEFLVIGDIPKEAITAFVTYNESAKNKLLKFGVTEPKVKILKGYYF